MNHLSKAKGIMNWVLIGAVIGLSIGLLRILFNWDRTFANYVLFGTAGLIFLAFFLRMMFDYYRVKKFLNHYMALLDQRQFDAYIDAVSDAIEQTKTKSFKDIHRMNLAIGYSYKGLYDDAINELKTVYETTKANTKTSVFCLINIIYLSILKKDYRVANKLVQSTKEILELYQKDAQYGLLININYAYLAMDKEDLKEAERYIKQANALSKALNSGLLEVTRVNIEYALACDDIELAKESINVFKAMDLPPIEKTWIEAIIDQYKL